MSNHSLPYTTITSPDNRFKVWISRPNNLGQVVLNLSFSLVGRMPFVDGIDALDYVSVDSVLNIDRDLSHVRLTMANNKDAVKLIDDLPDLMARYLADI